MFKSHALASIASLAFASILTTSGQAAAPQPGEDPIAWCVLNGGETIDQPPGSPIRACCTADGCIICDANWGNCEFDPAYGVRPNAGQAVIPGLDMLAPADPSPSRATPNPVAPLLLQSR